MVDVVIAFIAYVCITLRPIVGYCIVKKDNADLQRKLHDLECLRDSRLGALEKEHSTNASRNRQLLQEMLHSLQNGERNRAWENLNWD